MNALQIALAVIELVKIAEKLMPEGGKGAEKTAMVRSALEEIVGDVTEMWPNIQKLIDITVKLANAFGTFKK